MYAYSVDNLTIGSHEDTVFKAGRVIFAKLSLPALMPLFLNSRISVFKEGGSAQYNLGSEVGILNLLPEPGLVSGHIQHINDPTFRIASLQFSFSNEGKNIPWVRSGDKIVPQASTQVEEYTITLQLADLQYDIEDQRIFLRVEGECGAEGLFPYTAWAIILLRKQSLGGITLKWIIP